MVSLEEIAKCRISDCKQDEHDELNLASLSLDTLPSDVFAIKILRTLNLSYNRIEYLPGNLDILSRLQLLNLANNKLESLPPCIGNLKLLTKLQAQNNRLKILPEELGNLSRLEELYVGGNRLPALFDSIGSLRKLQRVDAQNNKIEHLPESFTKDNLKRLTVVGFQGNPVLEHLPWEIKCIQDLVPIMTDVQERRFLVKRALKIRRSVNARLITGDFG